MKKAIILLTIIFASCQKPDFYKEGQSLASKEFTSQLTSTTSELIGSQIYIPEDEGGWDTWYTTGRVGLFNAARTVSYTTANTFLSQIYGGKVALGQRVKTMSYDCLVANGVPGDNWDTALNNPITVSGVRDFLTIGGIQPTPLSITTYANGDIYLGRIKDEFYYENTDTRIGAAKGSIYPGKNYVWWGHGDTYRPTVIIPDSDGKYVIAVTLDYGKPNPTTSLLPIKVTGTTVVTDTTAIEANKAKPATNYKAIIQRGKIKGVTLWWEGNGYAYCIERDGVMIVKWQDIRSYFDPSGSKFSQYKIITRAQGRIPDAETPVFKLSK